MEMFFWYALAAGAGIAVIAGPLGCFIVWRRMAYFGDTVAHSALLGAGLSFLLDQPALVGVVIVAVSIAICLALLEKHSTLPSDSLLGILSHAMLALGLLVIGLMAAQPAVLLAYLLGDILAVNGTDILVIYGFGALLLLALMAFWKPLLAATISEEMAEAENQNPRRTHFAFVCLVALFVALAIKIVGVLLITALLIIPAAAARSFAATPEGMAVIASGLGVVAVGSGLAGSLWFDAPSGPAIVLSAFMLFLFSLIGQVKFRRANPSSEDRKS